MEVVGRYVSTMNIYDDNGVLLHATVELTGSAQHAVLTFESRGPSRNTAYLLAFDTALARLGRMQATIIDAFLVSREARHLAANERRLDKARLAFPVLVLDETHGLQLASQLRSAAAATGREPGARGAGNRTKRVEVHFSVAEEGDAMSSLAERILNPSRAIENVGLEEFVRPRARAAAQGLNIDAESRRIVELYAMERAIAYFSRHGAAVQDVSSSESYDLACTDETCEFHVEVKGTTGAGRSVLLTRNEVAHAEAQFPNIALFVVSEIRLEMLEGKRVATGGVEAIYKPWRIAREHLEAVTFNLFLNNAAAAEQR